MNISSIGNRLIATQMQIVNSMQEQQSAAMSNFKGAMKSPEQFLQLLEQSATIKQTEDIASHAGMILDVSV